MKDLNRKLFISFTGTMAALVSGRVNDNDLRKGLFVFGCTRGHAMTPGAFGEPVEHLVLVYPQLHAQLVEALIASEAAGRVRWRTVEQGNASFELVDEVLTANGYEPLMPIEKWSEDKPCLGWSYNYPAVAERSTELDVVFDGHVRDKGEVVEVTRSDQPPVKRDKNDILARTVTFRDAAEAQGLCALDSRFERAHWFDLNMGTISSPAEAASVKRLVELASTFAVTPQYGEHVALLSMIAPAAEVELFDKGERAVVRWCRPYYTTAHRGFERWITLKEWLTQQNEVPECVEKILGASDTLFG